MALIRKSTVKSVLEHAGKAPRLRAQGLAWIPALGRLGHRCRGHLSPGRCEDGGRRTETFRTPSRPMRVDYLMGVTSPIYQFVIRILGCEQSSQRAKTDPIIVERPALSSSRTKVNAR